MLREDSDYVLTNVLLSQVLSVLGAKEDKGEHWEQQVDHVVRLLAHLPRRDLTRVRLTLEIVGSSMKPVTIAIDMKFVEVSEFVGGVMLQVVRLDLIILAYLRLVHESSTIGNSCRLKVPWNRVLLSTSNSCLSEHGCSSEILGDHCLFIN